jgi:hypothetical protein
MRTHTWILTTAVLLALPGPRATAESGTHTESFTTTTYRDVANTTAHWDVRAGELRLWGDELVQVGLLFTSERPSDVDIDGDHLFIANGNDGLLVVDITNPAAPIAIGSWTGVLGTAGALDVEGDLLYLSASGAQGSELIVIDVSRPATPVKLSSIQHYGEPHGLVVAGNFVFIAAGADGRLQVVEVTDPVHPVLRNGVSCGDARDVAVVGDLAYVADFGGNLRVVDITDPTAASIVSTTPVTGNPRGITIRGHMAYVAADDDGGLQMIDVRNPITPDPCGEHPWCFAGDVAVSGHYAYVGDVEDGVVAFDVRDADLPRLMRWSTPGFNVARLLVDGRYLYALDGYGDALRVLRIASPVTPESAASLSLSAPSYGLAIDGHYAYVAGGGDGVHVVDIGEPTAPVLLDSDDVMGSAYAVEPMGRHLLLGTWNGGTYVYDVSDPAAIVQVDHLDTPLYVYDIAVHGDHAYVAARSDGLRVFDVSDPTAIQSVGSYVPIGQAHGVAVAGDRAYVAGTFGFRVCDIGVATAPTELGTLGTTGYDIALAGDYAFVAGGTFGLRVIDVSISTSPALVATVPLDDYAASVAVEGDLAFVADSEGGMYVFDIRDPTSPVLSHTDPPPSIFVSGVALSGDYALWVGDAGLSVTTRYARLVDAGDDVGRSLTIAAPDDDITRARLSAVASGTIAWEVSADGGAHWQSIPSSGVWQDLAHVGRDLRWRSTLAYDVLGLNPTCREVTIEWETPSVGVDGSIGAAAFRVEPPRPNPFRSRVRIRYELPEGAGVSFAIYDPAGRLVRVLRRDVHVEAGVHDLAWDGRDDAGRVLPAGTYYYVLDAGGRVQSGTITTVR